MNISYLMLIGVGSIAIILSSTLLHSQKQTLPKIGSIAPNFSLEDDKGNLQTLSTMRGSRVALYFYPKDQTPGCTAQACSIRDSLGALQKEAITVWGISYDSSNKHAAFKEKYHLTFPLLSDSDKKVAALYGVQGFLFAQRITFLIDEQGCIIGIIKDVNVKNHGQQILDGFAKVENKQS